MRSYTLSTSRTTLHHRNTLKEATLHHRNTFKEATRKRFRHLQTSDAVVQWHVEHVLFASVVQTASTRLPFFLFSASFWLTLVILLWVESAM